MSGWAPLKSWPLTVELFLEPGDQPWHDEHRLDDLAWHWSAVELYRKTKGRRGLAKMPGRPFFRKRWRCTDHVTRTTIADTADWQERTIASPSPANRQPVASESPAPEQSNADNDTKTTSESPARRQPVASPSPGDISLTARGITRTLHPAPSVVSEEVSTDGGLPLSNQAPSLGGEGSGQPVAAHKDGDPQSPQAVAESPASDAGAAAPVTGKSGASGSSSAGGTARSHHPDLGPSRAAVPSASPPSTMTTTTATTSGAEPDPDQPMIPLLSGGGTTTPMATGAISKAVENDSEPATKANPSRSPTTTATTPTTTATGLPPWAQHWTKLSRIERRALERQGDRTLAFWGWFRDQWQHGGQLNPATRPEQNDALAIARALHEQAYDGVDVVAYDLRVIIEWTNDSGERDFFKTAQRRPQSLFRPSNIKGNLALSRAWRERGGGVAKGIERNEDRGWMAEYGEAYAEAVAREEAGLLPDNVFALHEVAK